MSARSFSFTSESVTEGHPDKVADQISDSVLDAVLTDDPPGRVACETLITTGLVVVAGEITTECYVDIPKLVRAKIQEIGYDPASQKLHVMFQGGSVYEYFGVSAEKHAARRSVAGNLLHRTIGAGRKHHPTTAFSNMAGLHQFFLAEILWYFSAFQGETLIGSTWN